MGFADDLRAGLAARPRRVAPKWFYDDEGSRLFERICETPEYYPTRTELALLDHHAPAIARLLGPGAEIVEPGAGASVKVRLLLAALERPRRFVPLDISGAHLAEAAAALRRDHPALDVQPLAADFTQPLALPPARGPRSVFYPGSSIGNFDPPEAEALLRRFAGWVAGGLLLVGVDLVKAPAVLHAAYNDAQGVTAAFNRNLLARANRELGTDFDLGAWEHAAFYHPGLQRIEMHLVSRCAQRVHLGAEVFDVDEGESIHTENSYKYTVPGFQALARRAGLAPVAVWMDGGRRFALHALRPMQEAG